MRQPTDQRIESHLVFDPTSMLARIGGDESLLTEIIDLFVEDTPTRLAAVEQSVASVNPAALRKSAHYLKGALALFDVPAAGAAEQLEQMGRDGDLDRAAEVLSKLQQETQRLLAALDRAGAA